MAYDRMKALDTYLSSCKDIENFPAILEGQCTQLLKEIGEIKELNFEQGAPLLAMVQQSHFWTKTMKTQLSTVIHQKVTSTMQNRMVNTSGRAQLQDYSWFPAFLSACDWKTVLEEKTNSGYKVAILVDRTFKLGLRHPTEDTCAMVTSVLLLNEPQMFHNSLQLRNAYVSFKTMFKDRLKIKREARNPDAQIENMKDLPPTPDQLTAEQKKLVYGDGGPAQEMPYSMERLREMMQIVPQRGNAKALSLNFPKSFGNQMDQMAQYSLMAASAMACNMNMMQLQHAHHAAMTTSSSLASTRFPLALPAPPTVPAVAAAPVSAPAPATSPSVVCPEVIVVKPEHDKKELLAITNGDEKKGESMVEKKDSEKKHDALVEKKEPVASAAAEKNSVAVAEQLAKALAARDQDKKDEKVENPEGNSQGVKRPAEVSNSSVPVMKKPAAAPKTMKRPAAAASSGLLKAPAPKPAAATPKPKAGVEKAKPKAKSHCKGPISKKMRLQLKPSGCSKCRYVAGCCNSCWRGRGYRVD